jgi:uncharacterized membrane-anchored protein
MKTLLLILVLAPLSFISNAQIDSAQLFIDSLEARFEYRQGQIELSDSIGTLNVPNTFRYLDAEQSRYVLEELWGNPEDTTVLGMIVPANRGLMADDSWAFIITFEELGYVEDGDAGDIDYDELLDEMKVDASAANEYRKSEGYDPIEIVGWASEPFYDEEKKVLHWAKEIKFGDSPFNTLNYNVRILGRKGVLVLNAVSPMEELAEVKESITPVLSSFTYADGAKYSDFDPNVDEVAAWTIGGLVAGKVLAKAGFFALFLKYIKFIILGLGAIGTGVWKWYKRKTTLPDVRNLEDSTKA